MQLFVGTSGYSYKEWKGPFYPEDLPAAKMLHFYASRFPAVEINNTYYRMPSRGTLAAWAEQVPPEFRFAFKAPQRITHQQRLKETADLTRYLFETLSTLGGRLGPVLFGLPPSLKKDLARLERFLAELPAGAPAAFEFRHASWFDDEVYAALRAYGAALCVADAEELRVPFVPTADWGYLRLRRASYDDEGLRGWANRIRQAAWRAAYVFLKHEDEGRAPALAERFGLYAGD